MIAKLAKKKEDKEMQIIEVHGLWDRHHTGSQWPWDQDRLVVEPDNKQLPINSNWVGIKKLIHSDGIFWVQSLGEGLFDFIHHSGEVDEEGKLKNTYGFGGQVYKVTLEDGTQEEIPGPWSSGSYHYNTVVSPEDWLFEVALQLSVHNTWSVYLKVSEVIKLLKDTPYQLLGGASNLTIVHENDLEKWNERVK